MLLIRLTVDFDLRAAAVPARDVLLMVDLNLRGSDGSSVPRLSHVWLGLVGSVSVDCDWVR